MNQSYGFDKYINNKDLEGTTRYVVKSGDTLYNIAEKYDTTVSKIVTLNNLTSTMIYPNQVLFIPTKSDKITLKKYLESINVNPNLFDDDILQIMVRPKKVNEYKILNTDTLDLILGKTGLSAYELINLNKDNWLKPGDRIIIK